MHSIHNIVESLNESLSELFGSKRFIGSKIHTVAVTVLTKNGEKMPVIIDKKGEGHYVGIDDRFPVRLYHKFNTMNTKVDQKTGMGRGIGDIINTYSLSMIVFLNRKRACLMPDEFLLLIQSNFPDFLKLEPYSSIKILFTNAILNDMQVYNQEYLIPEKLLPEHNLFQINYTVETSFRKGCFNKCPED